MQRNFVPAALIFEQNPQDCCPNVTHKQISIQPPNIEEVPLREMEDEEEVLNAQSDTPQEQTEELDEVEQLFLRVQAECNRSRLHIRPMLEEIEEEQARLFASEQARVPTPPKPEVRIENLERREESSTFVLTFRSMGPVKMTAAKPKHSKKKTKKQRKRIQRHPEWIDELLALVLEMKRNAEEMRDWQMKTPLAKRSGIVDRRIKVLTTRREELQAEINECQCNFPESIQLNLQKFITDESVSVSDMSAEEVSHLKDELFPGLIRQSVREFLCGYRGPIEYPYSSSFDSAPFIELLERRWQGRTQLLD